MELTIYVATTQNIGVAKYSVALSKYMKNICKLFVQTNCESNYIEFMFVYDFVTHDYVCVCVRACVCVKAA